MFRKKKIETFQCSYSDFLQDLENAKVLSCTFFFKDDLLKRKHKIGCTKMKFIQKMIPPYWIDKKSKEKYERFDTAVETLEAPLFFYKSMKDKWDMVVFIKD